MKSLIIIAAGLIGLAYGDPVLVWTGDPVISVNGFGFYGGEVDANDASHDISSSYHCFGQAAPSESCSPDVTVSRTFTVVSPGSFSLASSLNISISAINCGPGGCAPYAYLDASYTESDRITGPTPFGESVSDSGSNTNPCPPDVLFCSVSLRFNNSQGNTVDLAAGDYTLDQDFLLDIYSGSTGGDTTFSASVNTDLVTTTPEPKNGFMALAVGFVMILLVRKHFNPIVRSNSISAL